MSNIFLAILILVSGVGMATNLQGPNNGYDGPDGWVPGWIDWQTWFTPAPKHITGNAVYYAPGVMEATANYRQLSLEGFLDGVSLMSPADIGKTVWIKLPNKDWEGPYLSVDCSQQNHMYTNIVYRGEVIEVGFETARKWGMAIGGDRGWRPLEWRMDNIEVFIGDSPPTTKSTPVDYRSWFLSIVKFRTTYERRPVFYPPTTWRLPDGTFLDSSK